MNTSQLNIDIKEEQKKAKDIIDKQGLRVLVCAGTGCVANGSLKVIEKFKELGADVSVLTDYDKMTIVPTGCHGFLCQGGDGECMRTRLMKLSDREEKSK